MSSKTKNLGLLKKDPILDKNDTFNIQTMLNDNWDKLDGAVGGGFQQAKAYTDEQISLVTATGIPKLVSYPLQVVATEDKQTNFEIPLDNFEASTDTLLVVINRAFLDASQYTVKAATRDEAGKLVKRAEIELTKGVNVDSKISLIVLKNVPIGTDGSINGAVLATESVPINRVNGLQDKLDEAFQAGNERKSELVAALIAKGIEATTDDSWSDLLDKVESIIKATGDATAGDIRQGKKATTDNGEVVGTMPTRSDVFKAGNYFNDLHNTFLDSEVTLDSGYYPENTKVRIQINDSNFKSENIKSGVTMFGEEGSYIGAGNAVAGDIRQGKTASTDAGDVVGSLPVRIGGTVVPSTVNQTKQAGVYDTNIVIQGDADLVAGNIRQGVDLFGVVGTLNPMPTGNYTTTVETIGIPSKSVITRSYSSPTDITLIILNPNGTSNGDRIVMAYALGRLGLPYTTSRDQSVSFLLQFNKTSKNIITITSDSTQNITYSAQVTGI
ncbi:hypothetical protein ABE099_10745 [Paenibacillus turicensis]|uniref:hypothetical protein n=1 Tax=Paenibacillus turicensis TaxID=160487 RepID=UPI003D2A3C42